MLTITNITNIICNINIILALVSIVFTIIAVRKLNNKKIIIEWIIAFIFLWINNYCLPELCTMDRVEELKTFWDYGGIYYITAFIIVIFMIVYPIYKIKKSKRGVSEEN